MIWGLYGATILFLISSVLLISNAIRLSIFARRNEIEVMKLVGASDSFVRTPFVFEGMVQGDRKSTRLNSSHANISYAVFCLKKKNTMPSHPCKTTHRTLA